MNRPLSSLWVLLALACAQGPTDPAPALAEIRVTLPRPSLRVGESLQAVAVGVDADGRPIPELPIRWASGTPDRATVSASGLVTAIAPGAARITASSGSRSGWVEVPIDPVRVPVVAVRFAEGAVLDLVEGASAQLVVSVLGPADSLLLDRALTWVSLRPDVATVSGSGGVTAITAGVAHVIAASEGVSDTVEVRVTRVPAARVELAHGGVVSLYTGESWQLAVRVFAADDRELEGRDVTWSSEDPAIASVTPSGAVTALTVGSTDAVAAVEGLTARAALDVRSHIHRIVVSPSEVVLGSGETETLAVQLLDRNGWVLERDVMWSTDNPEVVTVDADGRLTAAAAGSALVRAQAEGQEGWASVRVLEWVDRPLTGVGDSALPATLYLGTIEAPGAPPRAERVVAVGGILRVILTGSMAGRYQLRVSTWILRDGEPLHPAEIGFSGAMTYSPASGTLLLTVAPGLTLTAVPGQDGAWQVTGRIWTAGEVVTLHFGRPAGW